MAKKKAKKKSSTAPTAVAAADALMAFSTPASAADVKNEIILRCIVSTFDAEGLNHIGSQQDRIVWQTIDDSVIILLGDGITDCINSKEFHCIPLAPEFQNLKNMGQVTVVSNLVAGIAGLVEP